MSHTTNVSPTRPSVAIIGGGPSSVAMLGALLRRGEVRSVTVIDPNPPGLGQVFGEMCAGDPSLICNTSIGAMFLADNERDRYFQYLVDRGWPVSPEDCSPRYLFGEFCREEYGRYAAQARSLGIGLAHVPMRARGVRPVDDHYRIELDDGSLILADNVLVCVGLEAPVLPSVLAEHEHDPRLTNGAYPVSRLRALEPAGRTLVFGLRSSGLDAMQALCDAGHTVVMTSPSGRLSAVRDRLAVPPRPIVAREDWLGLDADDPDVAANAASLLAKELAKVANRPLPLDGSRIGLDAAGRLREDYRLASAGETPWSDLIFDAVGLLNDIIGAWDVETRSRLMPRMYETLTRYVNAIPLLMARRLLAHIEQGTASISPVAASRAEPSGSGWLVTWKDGRQERFDHMVAASGIHYPRFCLDDSGTLRFGHTGDIGNRSPVSINESLQLVLPGRRNPERIWGIGPSSQQRLPMAQVIFLTAQQVDDIARQVGSASAFPAWIDTELHEKEPAL